MSISISLSSAAGIYDAFKKKALSGNAVIPVLFLNTLFSWLIFLPFIILSYTGNSLDEQCPIVAEGGWEVQQVYRGLKSFIVLGVWMLGYFGIEASAAHHRGTYQCHPSGNDTSRCPAGLR